MRLPGFPVAVADETIPSTVARHLHRTAGSWSRSLSILGLRRAAVGALVPPNIGQLAEAMPPNHPWSHDVHEIVARHTLVPLYLHFATPSRSAAVLSSVLAGSSGNPNASLGLTRSTARAPTPIYKFCPECVAFDSSPQGRGFSVAYREHQPGFVWVCSLHRAPLLFGCTTCQSKRKAVGMWRMAGRCECHRPQHASAYAFDGDPTSKSSAIWIAEQVRTILRNPSTFPESSQAVRLRAALVEAGFGARTGLDADAIVSAMHARFGRKFLEGLGVPETARTNGGARWPSRLLGSSAVSGERIPCVLLSLLMAGLVTDSLEGLGAFQCSEETSASAAPRGYGQRPLSRGFLSPEAIAAALGDSKGKIAAAAQRLGVSPAQLAVDMQRQGLRLPLPSATAKRLGSDLIANVRHALQAGTPKIEIQRSLKVSEWSIQLIELDAPELRDAHRQATIQGQRDKHRHVILQYCNQHPAAGRSELAKHCAAAMDWLRTFDFDWLKKNLPEQKYGVKGKRTPRRDWHQFDLSRVEIIRRTVQDELRKLSRPERLTASRLLNSAC